MWNFVFLCCVSLCFMACSSLVVKPDNSTYNNGIAIMQDTGKKQDLKYKLYRAVLVPLILYVALENLSDETL